MPCGTSSVVSTTPATMSLASHSRRYVDTARSPGTQPNIDTPFRPWSDTNTAPSSPGESRASPMWGRSRWFNRRPAAPVVTQISGREHAAPGPDREPCHRRSQAAPVVLSGCGLARTVGGGPDRQHVHRGVDEVPHRELAAPHLEHAADDGRDEEDREPAHHGGPDRRYPGERQHHQREDDEVGPEAGLCRR